MDIIGHLFSSITCPKRTNIAAYLSNLFLEKTSHPNLDENMGNFSAVISRG
jgi:hypothetical protein